MKKILTCVFLGFFSIYTFGQKIQMISAYDNESSYTSGLYAVQDTAVYRYSWYYHEWFPLENNGLTRVNDTIRISSLTVYNNKTSNSSGIFVFSDSAVFNYNWITATWYPLSNDGIPRIGGKPDVRMLTVYGDSGSSSNSTLFALTDTAVYCYRWFYQDWYALSNTGLPYSIKENSNFNEIVATAFPNPCESPLFIKLKFPFGIKDKINVAVFDEKGSLVNTFVKNTNGETEITLTTELERFKAGMYFYEIKAGKSFKTIRVIK